MITTEIVTKPLQITSTATNKMIVTILNNLKPDIGLQACKLSPANLTGELHIMIVVMTIPGTKQNLPLAKRSITVVAATMVLFLGYINKINLQDKRNPLLSDTEVLSNLPEPQTWVP